MAFIGFVIVGNPANTTGITEFYVFPFMFVACSLTGEGRPPYFCASVYTLQGDLVFDQQIADFCTKSSSTVYLKRYNIYRVSL